MDLSDELWIISNCIGGGEVSSENIKNYHHYNAGIGCNTRNNYALRMDRSVSRHGSLHSLFGTCDENSWGCLSRGCVPYF
mmetsp:Transcript_16955/g.38732  ORF Transcript_16955/g.38732 Transcript_16955/m.38732 type:complete len:80 (+) Transcript_16955:146-385(+)